jgi:hypothetical protein
MKSFDLSTLTFCDPGLAVAANIINAVRILRMLFINTSIR